MKNRGNSPLTIDAPIGGLNLISAPNRIPLNQARELTNYLVRDNGIEEFGGTDEGPFQSGDVGVATFGLVSFISVTGTEILTWSQRIGGTYRLQYLLDGVFAGAECTYGAGAQAQVNAGACVNPVSFAQNMYYFSGTQRVIRVGPSTLVADLAGYTINGGAVDTPLVIGTSYKSRMFAIEGGSNRYHYGALFAITGAMTAVDLTGVFQKPGSLLSVSNWTFNPGNANDEYIVFINTAGEILVYSGTDPSAANWGLVARLSCPKPLTPRCFAKFGSELFITTSQGVITMSSLLAGRGIAGATYVSSTRNIKDAIDPTYPIAIWESKRLLLGSDVNNGSSFYAQNLELGAWSALRPNNAPGIGFMGLAYAAATTNNLYCLERNNGNIRRFREPSDTEYSVWKTPFIGSTGQNVRINKVKLQGKKIDVGLPEPFRNSGAIEIIGDAIISPTVALPANYDSQNTALAGGPKQEIYESNLNIGGTGDEWSFVQWHEGTTRRQPQTIYGATVWVEDTGSIE